MPDRIVRESLSLSSGDQERYSVYQQTTEAGRRSPLLLCLHPGWSGHTPSPHYGEEFLTSMFIPAFAETGATIVAPDCPGSAWNNPKSRLAILELLDHLIGTLNIDSKRVSLVGYSAGGWGAWYYLLENAERFSSAILLATLPVIDAADGLEENMRKCSELLAGRLSEWGGRLPDLPIYIIHSEDDELLPYRSASRAYQILLDDKRQVVFNTIQGIGHFDGEGYIESLRAAVPWLTDTWTLSELSRG